MNEAFANLIFKGCTLYTHSLSKIKLKNEHNQKENEIMKEHVGLGI